MNFLGQETTTLSTMPFFAHMGMIYVPLGSKNPNKPEPNSVNGGSAWGAGTIAGHGKKIYLNFDLKMYLL